MKKKRKARKELAKKHDLLFPIPVTELGSESDPCFGKLNDPRNEVCAMCGDSEFCSIVTAQNLAIKRKKLEKNQTFKDIGEKDLKLVDPKEIRKAIRNRIRQFIRLAGNIGTQPEMVISDINSIYAKDGFTKTRIKKIMDKVIDGSDKITFYKKQNLLKWKS